MSNAESMRQEKNPQGFFELLPPGPEKGENGARRGLIWEALLMTHQVSSRGRIGGLPSHQGWNASGPFARTVQAPSSTGRPETKETLQGFRSGHEPDPENPVPSTVPGRPELIRPLGQLLVLFEHPPEFIVDFLLVLDTGEEDADPVAVILEVRGLVIDDERDLALLPEDLLLALAPHVPFPLLLCRGRIFTVVPEDTHNYSFRITCGCS